MIQCTIADRTYTNIIGPCAFNSKFISSKTENVFIAFSENGFYILFQADEDLRNIKVNRFVMECLYSHIMSFDKKVKKIQIYMKDDPFWEYLYPLPTLPPRVQRVGFANFSILTSKANINILYAEISKHAYSLIIPTFLPPSASYMDSITNISESVQFSVAKILIDNIPIYINNLRTYFQEIYHKQGNEFIPNIFMEKYNFVLEYSIDRIVMEALDPLYALKQALQLTFNRETVFLYRIPYRIGINLDYVFLNGPQSEQFLSDPTSTVNIFISSASVGDVNIDKCMEYLRQFLVSPLWQKTDFIPINDDDPTNSVLFGMAEIFGRETWTCPIIAFQHMEKTLAIFTMNALKSDNFIKHIRDEQPNGKFKKGVTSAWLPDCYYSIFTFEQSEKTIINHIEIIGWDFDPELNGLTKRQFALLSSQKLANFVSFIKMKTDISE